MTRRKLLWVGDAGCQTGFGRVSDNVLGHLYRDYDVHVLAVNYHGDPHPLPYPLYPASLGGDWRGFGRYGQMVNKLRPDVIVINNDSHVVKGYLDLFHKTKKVPADIPVIAYIPVDGNNVRYDWVPCFNLLHMAVLYTEFGAREFRDAGYGGRIEIVPHGVDTEVYRPVGRAEARKALGLESVRGAFIVGNVNNNQMRKRLDLTVEHFCQWVKDYDVPKDVLLFLHCKTEGKGYDLSQLMQYWGHRLYGDRDRIATQRFIATSSDVTATKGFPETYMKNVYSALDLHVSTTMGEGWGLTTMESMACGVPNLVPDHAALGEWTGDAACRVPCSSFQATPGNLNQIGGVVDGDLFRDALHEMYLDAGRRNGYARAGLELVRETRFNWESIADRFDDLISEAIVKKKPRLLRVI